MSVSVSAFICLLFCVPTGHGLLLWLGGLQTVLLHCIACVYGHPSAETPDQCRFSYGRTCSSKLAMGALQLLQPGVYAMKRQP